MKLMTNAMGIHTNCDQHSAEVLTAIAISKPHPFSQAHALKLRLHPMCVVPQSPPLRQQALKRTGAAAAPGSSGPERAAWPGGRARWGRRADSGSSCSCR